MSWVAAVWKVLSAECNRADELLMEDEVNEIVGRRAAEPVAGVRGHPACCVSLGVFRLGILGFER